jgi:hypothetical protein
LEEFDLEKENMENISDYQLKVWSVENLARKGRIYLRDRLFWGVAY